MNTFLQYVIQKFKKIQKSVATNNPLKHTLYSELNKTLYLSSLKRRTLFFVLSIHMSIFFLFFDSHKSWNHAKPNRIVVRTKSLSGPPKVTVSHTPSKESSNHAKQKNTPLLKTEMIPKKPPPSKPRPTTTRRPPARRTPVQNRRPQSPPSASKQILKNINRNLGAAHTSQASACTQNRASSGNTEPSQIDIFGKYVENVTSIFQAMLTLPEKGAVKLTISVQPNGKIATIEMVSSESSANLEYLLKILPSITLPTYDFQKSVDFTITFRDD